MNLIQLVTKNGQFDLVCEDCWPYAIRERERYGQVVTEMLVETAEHCGWCGKGGRDPRT